VQKLLSDPKDREPKRHAHPDGREREEHEDHVAALNRLTGQFAAQQKDQKAADSKKEFREWFTIILVAFTLGATGFGDWVFFHTMEDARDAAAKAHRDSAGALTAAKTSAAAALTGAHQDSAAAVSAANAGSAAALDKAEAANATARDSENRQLRAYVVVSGYGVQDVSVGGTPWARIHIYNAGLTPVRQEWVGTTDISIAASAGGRVSGGGTSADCYRRPLARDARVYDSIKEVFPTVRTKAPLTQAQYEGLMAGRLKLVAAGLTCYRDIFGRPHRTDFCLEYSNAQPAPFQEAAVCVRGNKSD
jgi:hypothetical protein